MQRNSPANGKSNVPTVSTGTGETLPGPIIRAVSMAVVAVGMVIGSDDAL